MQTIPDPLEQYLLLLLSDSNLPTGGFVASSGLESYIQHGYISSSTASTLDRSSSILNFIKQSLHACANMNLAFVSTSHQFVQSLLSAGDKASIETTFGRLKALDHQFEVMTLNHIARRASTAQGIALIKLYEKAFAIEDNDSDQSQDSIAQRKSNPSMIGLNERLKVGIRQGEMNGHFPIGFGILTALLGLSLISSQHLFLFLHCRSILSSSVRLNTLGPYLSHRLLLHDVKPLVQEALERHQHLKVDLLEIDADLSNDRRDFDQDRGQVSQGEVAMTWPLGEILQARHDQLHSKIFNS